MEKNGKNHVVMPLKEVDNLVHVKLPTGAQAFYRLLITVKIFENLKKFNPTSVIELVPPEGGETEKFKVSECNLIGWEE